MTKPLKILLIGPHLNKQNSNVGGATLSFQYLVEYFQSHSRVSLKQINTQQSKSQIYNYIFTVTSLFFQVLNTQVVFTCLSQNGIRILAPLIFIISKFFGKKVIIRPFGGHMKDQYLNYSKLEKLVFNRTISRSDIFYLQTKMLFNFFRTSSKNVKQLPTTRAQPPETEERNQFRKRFVFFGHVKKSKGINEILNLKSKLDSTYTIDIYGPIQDTSLDHLKEESVYKGIIPFNQMAGIMKEYDVLLLPTYYEGEGYPGVVAEDNFV